MPRRKKQENIESAEPKESELELAVTRENESKSAEEKDELKSEPKNVESKSAKKEGVEAAKTNRDSTSSEVSGVAVQSVPSPLADLKAKIESILYCIPSGVTVELLAHKVNMASKETVQWALEELKKDYEAKTGSLKVVFDGGVWKFKVPDEHISVIQDAAQPEFDKAVIETLAYIAWRNGSRQCDVVRVRGNKAYNHIKLLKEKGFIESHKSGLSKWLEPTKKFSEYFNLKKGEKLPIPEEVHRAAEEAEKAAAAVTLQQQEQEAQQAHIVGVIKENVEAKKKSDDKKESESEEEPEPGGEEPDSGEEPEPGPDGDEEPEEGEGDEEENKSKSNDFDSPASQDKSNPDNE